MKLSFDKYLEKDGGTGWSSCLALTVFGVGLQQRVGAGELSFPSLPAKQGPLLPSWTSRFPRYRIDVAVIRLRCRIVAVDMRIAAAHGAFLS